LTFVRDVIDPAADSGKGFGLAPIGHRVTVIGVQGFVIDVTADFTLADGWSFAEIRDDLVAVLNEYLFELASTWDANDVLVVRASQIESRLLNEPLGRVTDIAELRLNGGTVGRNITLSANVIPLRGTVVQNG
jgi:hypothetical protein